jgi:hypothetical protein
MKTELKTMGTVTLNRDDLTKLISDYLKTSNHLATRKITFVKETVIAEVETEEKEKTVFKKGAKLNKGLFPKLREYFKYEQQRKHANVKFTELWEVVRTEFPHMSEERLQMYLHDKRQLPDISYDKNKNLIYLKNGSY